MEDAIRQGLLDWREDTLLNLFYPGIEILGGDSLLPDDVIEKLATCGEKISTVDKLAAQIRWPLGIDLFTQELTDTGRLLLGKLQEIYDEVEAEQQRQEDERRRLSEAVSGPIPANRFYGTRSITRNDAIAK